jgi:hypothetical protein
MYFYVPFFLSILLLLILLILSCSQFLKSDFFFEGLILFKIFFEGLILFEIYSKKLQNQGVLSWFQLISYQHYLIIFIQYNRNTYCKTIVKSYYLNFIFIKVEYTFFFRHARGLKIYNFFSFMNWESEIEKIRYKNED